jgi:hypothetical protein
MDRRLKDILDKYFPYTDDELEWGVQAEMRRQKKREIRLRIEKVVNEYNETKQLNLPTDLSIDMIEVIKKLTSEN